MDALPSFWKGNIQVIMKDIYVLILVILVLCFLCTILPLTEKNLLALFVPRKGVS